MNKLVTIMVTALFLFSLTACFDIEKKSEESISETITGQSQNVSPSSETITGQSQTASPSANTIIEQSQTISPSANAETAAALSSEYDSAPINATDTSSNPSAVEEAHNDVLSETYTIHHQKDDTTYIVRVMRDPSYNFTAHLYGGESNQLPTVHLGWCPEGIDFEDVNMDGYMDIVANTGGTINETHDLYIWDAASHSFTKVIYEGFDMLSFFEIHEGYIINFIRGDSPDYSISEKLIWQENKLVLAH